MPTFSILFLLRLSTIRLVHSARASILDIPCPERVTVKMTYGENLLVSVLRMEMFIFPPRSYFSLLARAPSLNFSMLMSFRLAPRSLELMLLSLT